MVWIVKTTFLGRRLLLIAQATSLETIVQPWIVKLIVLSRVSLTFGQQNYVKRKMGVVIPNSSVTNPFPMLCQLTHFTGSKSSV